MSKDFLTREEQYTIQKVINGPSQIDETGEIEALLREILSIVSDVRKKVFKKTEKGRHRELQIVIDTKNQIIDLLNSSNTTKRAIFTLGLWKPAKGENIRRIALSPKNFTQRNHETKREFTPYDSRQTKRIKGALQSFLEALKTTI